jgi:hypothetical protein
MQLHEAMSYNTTTQQVNWGRYPFEVCNKNGLWRRAAGLYIFAGVSDGRWRALYIGQTENFSDRIPDHERWDEAVRLGATHVHARLEANALHRATIERELIGAFRPPLNTHYR